MPVILLPQCPHIILSDNKYSTLVLPRDSTAAYLANTFCASAKSSSRCVAAYRRQSLRRDGCIAQIAAAAEYAVKTAFVPQAAMRCFYASFVQKLENKFKRAFAIWKSITYTARRGAERQVMYSKNTAMMTCTERRITSSADRRLQRRKDIVSWRVPQFMQNLGNTGLSGRAADTHTRAAL